MRWPEVEVIIRRLWKIMPDKYRTQHQFGKYHKEFVNWDCSKKGFEGIRAQDVLPLLKNYFDFKTFFAYGNLVDVFIERGYGHNLSPESEFDIAFIDLLEHLNEILIDSKTITPTMMIAKMTRKDVVLSSEIQCYKHWTPDHCTREVLD